MIELFTNPRYDFIGRRRWTYLASTALIVIALGSLVSRGLRYDIDFTGGTLIQVRFSDVTTTAKLRTALDRIRLGEAIIQQFGDPREYIIRTPQQTSSSGDLAKQVEGVLTDDRSFGHVEIRRVEFVGPQVGHDLQRQAVYAVIAALVGIVAYIALRFDLKGGLAAIVAVVHDVIVCFGALSLGSREFSLPVLAAVLTVVGYSVNDTIVAYDRLRENRGKRVPQPRSFADQMNEAINQTLSRTILTALTTFFAAFLLLLFGGSTLENFAFVLTIGVITGTYSTIYVAGALIVDWTAHVERREEAAAQRRRT